MKNSAEYNSVFIVELFDQAYLGQRSVGRPLDRLGHTGFIKVGHFLPHGAEEFSVIWMLVTDVGNRYCW